MYTVFQTKSFKKTLKKVSKRKEFDLEFLSQTLEIIASRRPLPDRYKDHKLEGEYDTYRECHLNNSLLLIYEVSDIEERIYLIKIGTHPDLFGK